MLRDRQAPVPHTAERSGGSRGTAPPIYEAVALLVFVAVLYIVGGITLQVYLGEPGLLLGQMLFMALPVVVLVKARGYRLKEVLALRGFDRYHLLAGVLLMSGGGLIALYLAWFQSLFMPVPVGFLEAMAEVLTADSVGRFVWLLLLAAVTPAIAEELLFRGALLSALRDRMPEILVVIVVGLVFGLFHTAPQTAFRILPTAWLGMVLAWVVIASGSLPLAVLLHFLNNGTLLALAALPATREFATGVEGTPPLVLLPVALLLFGVGVHLMRVRRRRGQHVGSDPVPP
ncbi:MAG: type II CAAX endopeptidase family protein [Gemmatimonadota bacterium]